MGDTLKKTKSLIFLKDTELRQNSLKGSIQSKLGRAESFKTYPNAAKISLPKSRWSLSEARIIPLLQNRRSLRTFSSSAIGLNELAFLLWSGQGITAQAGKHYLRTAPSAGAVYPIETYLSIQNVEGVIPGLYHLNPLLFELESLKEIDLKADISRAFLNQRFMEKAAVNIIWTAVSRRSLAKYGERGGRYLLLDAAHICQNVLLAAEAIDCGGCPVAAFYDQEVNELLEVDGVEETAIYSASIGKKAH